MALFDKSDSDNKTPSALDLEVAAAFIEMGTRDDSTPVKPGLAKETLISLLYQQADMLAKSGQEKQSSTLFEFAMHLSGNNPGNAVTEEGFAHLEQQARYLMGNGRFLLAAKVYETLVKTAPGNHSTHQDLAAIYLKLNRQKDAQSLLTDLYNTHPLEFVAADAGAVKKGTLLRVSGYDKTYFKIGARANGTFRRYRRGGHFMLTHLLDTDPYDIFSYTVSADNINQNNPDVQYGLLLNTIADADIEFRSLKSLETYVKKHVKGPIINHPSNVLKTTRDNNYLRLNKVGGIRFPKTERFSTEGITAQTIADDIKTAGFTFPFIIRETGTHTAVTTELISKQTELEMYLNNISGESLYIIEFIENASPEGHYTKMRFFAIDGQLYPVVRHVDEVWNVHGGNRKTFMKNHDWMVEKEKQFLKNPASVIGAETYALLQTLPDIIGLEFFGFDFTLLDNGEILIFELNPAMRHSFNHAENSPYMRPHLEAISAAFQTMIDQKVSRA